jgi:hypothetical protein
VNFPGHFDQLGRLRLRNREQWDAYGRSMAGRAVVLTVQSEEEKRTDDSNRYWFGAVVEFFRVQWSKERRRPFNLPDYTKEETHDAMVQILLGFEEGPHGARIRKATRDLPQSVFSKLIEDGKEMAWQDYQARIPDPDEWKALQS